METAVTVSSLLLVLDIAGTFVFGLSGAAAGIRHRLDLFGVLVLSFAAATAGGLARDMVIGAVPPVAIRDLRYVLVPVLAGLTLFRRSASCAGWITWLCCWMRPGWPCLPSPARKSPWPTASIPSLRPCSGC